MQRIFYSINFCSDTEIHRIFSCIYCGILFLSHHQFSAAAIQNVSLFLERSIPCISAFKHTRNEFSMYFQNHKFYVIVMVSMYFLKGTNIRNPYKTIYVFLNSANEKFYVWPEKILSTSSVYEFTVTQTIMTKAMVYFITLEAEKFLWVSVRKNPCGVF